MSDVEIFGIRLNREKISKIFPVVITNFKRFLAAVVVLSIAALLYFYYSGFGIEEVPIVTERTELAKADKAQKTAVKPVAEQNLEIPANPFITNKEIAKLAEAKAAENQKAEDSEITYTIEETNGCVNSYGEQITTVVKRG